MDYEEELERLLQDFGFPPIEDAHDDDQALPRLDDVENWNE